MEINPEIMRAAYAYLEVTPPFNEWNLPDADEIVFTATQTRQLHGKMTCARHRFLKSPAYTGPKAWMEISAACHSHTSTFLATVAHEIIHLHQHLAKVREPMHGPAFRAWAAQVCEAHGWDPRQF